VRIDIAKLKRSCAPLILLFTSACSTVIRPDAYQTETGVSKAFTHEQFDQVAKKFVNDHGRVNYSDLKKNQDTLDRYYAAVATFSPDSHPELFPDRNHELAYWINAYNAATIKTVLHYYPIKSLQDVKRPTLAFFLPRLSGFFLFQKQIFGGKEISLYSLENSLIRKRYDEPRIHFALNCASAGCPRLPRYAFSGERLEEQLEHEALKFFSEERNFSIDLSEKVIFVSSILDWFEEDFGDVRNYMAAYVPDSKKKHLMDPDFRIKYVEYDWSLNDQN